jgi:hypothetical protein
MGPPAGNARDRAGDPTAAASQLSRGARKNSRIARKRNFRRILADHLDSRVDLLLEGLAPDDLAAQTAVRAIRRGLEPALEEIAEGVGR